MKKDIIVGNSSATKLGIDSSCRMDCYDWWLYFNNTRVGRLDDYSEKEIFNVIQVMNSVASVAEDCYKQSHD